VVAAGDTVTMKVSVSGADFNGLQASVGYDSELFTLTGVTGAAAADDDRTAGVVELYPCLSVERGLYCLYRFPDVRQVPV